MAWCALAFSLGCCSLGHSDTRLLARAPARSVSLSLGHSLTWLTRSLVAFSVGAWFVSFVDLFLSLSLSSLAVCRTGDCFSEDEVNLFLISSVCEHAMAKVLSHDGRLIRWPGIDSCNMFVHYVSLTVVSAPELLHLAICCAFL